MQSTKYSSVGAAFKRQQPGKWDHVSDDVLGEALTKAISKKRLFSGLFQEDAVSQLANITKATELLDAELSAVPRILEQREREELSHVATVSDNQVRLVSNNATIELTNNALNNRVDVATNNQIELEKAKAAIEIEKNRANAAIDLRKQIFEARLKIRTLKQAAHVKQQLTQARQDNLGGKPGGVPQEDADD